MFQIPSIDFGFIEPFLKLISIISLPFGVLLLFYGYRFFKFLIALLGFFIGFAIGFAIGSITGEPFIPAILGGILCALIFYALYKIGIFVLGMIIGFLIGALIMAASNDFEPAILIGFAIMGGVIALIVEKFLIILFSSYQGSTIIVSGLGWIFYPEFFYRSLSGNINDYLNYSIYYFLFVFILSIIGILYQYQVIPNTFDRVFSNSNNTDNERSSNLNRSNNKEIYRNEVTLAKSQSRHVERENYRKITDKTTTEYPSGIGSTYTSHDQFTDVTKRSHSAPSFLPLNKEHKQKELHNSTDDTNVSRGQIPDAKLIPIELETISGLHQGQTYSVQGLFNGKYYTATIGREKLSVYNHIFIYDPDYLISRLHGEFALKEGIVYLRKLSQTNPLILNNLSLSKSTFEPLQNNDIIKMCNVILRVKLI